MALLPPSLNDSPADPSLNDSPAGPPLRSPSPPLPLHADLSLLPPKKRGSKNSRRSVPVVPPLEDPLPAGPSDPPLNADADPPHPPPKPPKKKGSKNSRRSVPVVPSQEDPLPAGPSDPPLNADADPHHPPPKPPKKKGSKNSRRSVPVVPSQEGPLPAGRFIVGDKVLAYYRQRPYPAKIISMRSFLNVERRYKVKYEGFNDKWNEWVNECRLMMDNESTRRRMKATNLYLNIAGTPAGGTPPDAPKFKRWMKKGDWTDFYKNEIRKRLHLDMSDNLYRRLVEHREVSLHVGKIGSIPRHVHNISSILNFFSASQQSNADALVDFCDDVTCAFNSSYRTVLLNTELKMLDLVCKDRTGEFIASQEYGAEQLLSFIAEVKKLSNHPVEDLTMEFGRLLAYLDSNDVFLPRFPYITGI